MFKKYMKKKKWSLMKSAFFHLQIHKAKQWITAASDQASLDPSPWTHRVKTPDVSLLELTNFPQSIAAVRRTREVTVARVNWAD